MRRFDAIPEELQEREQWLCWKQATRNGKQTKIPMQPGGGGNAKSNDPDTWGTFREAVETAQARDWGIGFVFTEDGPFAGVDLDDCLADDGKRPADWLPGLDPFTRTTYIERSPSGEGLHILLKAAEIPDWWTNQHGDDDGREVAVFDEGRYFTFTGDAIDASADEVAEVDGFDEWLVDAWSVFNDDPPRTSDDRNGSGTRDLSRRSRERVDVRVTDVVHAGYNVGERCEHPVHGSTTGSNFLIDEDDETFRCWRCDVTGNALHIVGMQEGIINCGDWKGTGLDTDTWAEIFDAAREHGLDVPDRPEPPSVEEAEEEGWLDWEAVRDFYDSEDRSTGEARQAAVNHLLQVHDFMTPRDTGSIWIYDDETGYYEKEGDSRIETLLANNLGSHYTQHEKREVLGKIRAATYCDRDTFDAGADDRQLLCVGNGVLNLEDRELLEHSPKFRFTRGVPVDYDPEADPEKVDAFMDEITSREEDKRTMYEMLGNALLPHYDHSAFLILFGEGANGKSTFFDVAEAMLGDDNVSGWGLQDLENNRFATSSLPGKFANVAPDLPSKSINQTGTIKALTGGDTMMAEEKGEPAFEFVNTAKLMFGANRPPVIQEASMAIKRRILPIRLPEQFTHAENDGNPDARPKHKLVAELTTEEELSGLLNKAVEGAERLRKTGQFSLPETPEERLEYYEQFSDPIKEFAINCLNNEEGEWVPKSGVYGAFKRFSEQNDYATRSKEVFFRQLRQVSTFTYDEFQPRDDDGGRVRGLNGATLTAEGLEYCDDLLLSKLGIDTGDEADEDTDSTTPTDLADVQPEGNPFCDVQVTVNRVQTKEKGPVYEATVSDATATLDLVDWDGVDALGDIEDGDSYRVSDVKAAYDANGTLHLQPVANTTEFKPTDTTEQTSLDPDDPRGSAAADGGTAASEPPDDDDPRKKVVQLAMAKKGEDDDRGVGHYDLLLALCENGMQLEQAKQEIKRALTEGRLQEPLEERYEPVL